MKTSLYHVIPLVTSCFMFIRVRGKSPHVHFIVQFIYTSITPILVPTTHKMGFEIIRIGRAI